MFRSIRAALVGASAVAALFAADIAQAQQQFVAIGTGGLTGVYYPAGGAICRMVNRDRAQHGIRCSVESTGGSVFNLNAIRSGELEFGIAQSDWQYHAFNGTSQFADAGPFEDLRAVFALHPEPFTLIVRGDSDIQSFEDLRGKRVNVGNPGSGQRATMEVVMEAFGISMSDFALAAELPGPEMPAGLCDNRFEAMIYTVGHPAAAIQEVTTTCDARLVSVVGEPIDRLVADRAYYSVATVPGGMYRGNDEDITTFGVGATFVTSAQVPEEAVYVLAKAVMENIDSFRGLHPALAVLEPATMVSDGLSAPLHPGAERAFRELGLID
ncbi:MAG: TAXI family TRAP transporter solute-binding subunit [Geminicoccaceae bacterium]|nr:MAG: TAXI family TRAP transporter solute-binding subunit [Geminicoccaceae bacterium]